MVQALPEIFAANFFSYKNISGIFKESQLLLSNCPAHSLLCGVIHRRMAMGSKSRCHWFDPGLLEGAVSPAAPVCDGGSSFSSGLGTSLDMLC